MKNIALINRAALAGLLAAPFYITLIIALGALEPGFSHRTSLMSVLGGVPGLRGLLFNLGVAATGICLIFFALGLRRQLLPGKAATIGVGFLAIGSFALIGAGGFHCNEGCRNILAEPDLVGRIHIIASLVGGMGTALAPFFIWAAMRGDDKWHDLRTPTLLAAIFANLPGIIFWITIFTGYRLSSFEGIIQRMGFIIILIWIFAVAMRLRRLSQSISERSGNRFA